MIRDYKRNVSTTLEKRVRMVCYFIEIITHGKFNRKSSQEILLIRQSGAQRPRGPVTELHLAEHKMTRTIATLSPSPPPILRWDTSPSQTTPPLPYFLKVFFLGSSQQFLLWYLFALL